MWAISEASLAGADNGVFERKTELQKLVYAARTDRKVSGIDRLRAASSYVDDDLRREGCSVLLTEDGASYLLWKPTGQLFNLDSDDMKTWLSGYIGVGPHEKDGVLNYIIDSLYSDAFKTQRVPVHTFASYDTDTGRLTVSDGAGGVWQRDRFDTWKRSCNGDSGQIFLTYGSSSAWVPEFGDVDALEWFFGRMSFDPTAQLSVAELRTLLLVFMLSLFFPPLRRTRPVPTFLGIKGSGKTSAIRLIGRLIEGDSFEVTDIRENNEDGYIASVCNSTIMGLDNADTQVSWLEDSLALYATGHEVRKRKLYSDNEMVSYRPRATLLLASRDPHFRRDDVAQRLLQFWFAPPEKYQAEGQLFDELADRRGKIMGALLTRAGKISDLLAEGALPQVSFRMADFAAFGWFAMLAEGCEAEWFPILEKLENAQARFATEGNLAIEAIATLLDRMDIRHMSAAELYEGCRGLSIGSAASFYKTPRAFSRVLCNLRPEIERELKVKMDVEKTDRTRFFTITKKPAEIKCLNS